MIAYSLYRHRNRGLYNRSPMKLFTPLLLALLPAISFAQSYDTADFPISFAEGAPGLLSASSLLAKPAGKDGPIVARDGHFYSGNTRIRFWGVNIAFSGNFPTHDQADKLAAR